MLYGRDELEDGIEAPEDIARIGQFALCRALNCGKVVGFIGSGVSVAYGRIDWKTMATESYEVAIEAAKHYIQSHGDVEKSERIESSDTNQTIDTLKIATLKKLLHTLESLTPEYGKTSEEIYTILEICDRIHKNINPESSEKFRKHIAKITRDDHEFTRLHLIKRLVYLSDCFADRKLARTIAKELVRYVKTAAGRRDTTDGRAVTAIGIPQRVLADLKANASTVSRPIRRALEGLMLIRSEAQPNKGQNSSTLREVLTSLLALYLADVELCEGNDKSVEAYRSRLQRLHRRMSDLWDTHHWSRMIGSFYRVKFWVDLLPCATTLIEKNTVDQNSLDVLNEMGTALRKLKDQFSASPALPVDLRSFVSIFSYIVCREARRNSVFSTSLFSAMGALFSDEAGMDEVRQFDLSANRPMIDPIGVLFRKLRLRRFLTTNYDYELEQYLEHTGFSRHSLSKPNNAAIDATRSLVEVRNSLGDIAKSFTFNSKEPSSLFEFGAGTSGINWEIFHLHGGARDPSSLVVTEGDYQRTYLGNVQTRQVFDEALDLLFSGNPILFVGWGMREADILRPLREFVSNYKSSTDNPLVALLPAPAKRGAISHTIFKYYVRYGVRVIFYGLTENENKTRMNKRKEHFESLDNYSLWLPTLMDYMDDISEYILTGDAFLLPSTENNRIKEIMGNNISGLLMEKPLIEFLMAHLKETPPSRMPPESRALLADFMLRQKDKIHSLALTRKLHGIEQDWRAWWDGWLLLPKRRSEEVYGTRAPEGSPEPEPISPSALHQRHVIWFDPDSPRLSPNSAYAIGENTGCERAEALVRWLDGNPPEGCDRIDAPGRRIVFVQCKGGQGKGATFTALKRVLSETAPSPNAASPSGRHAFLVSFKLSHEFLSTVDSVARFLIDAGILHTSSVGKGGVRREVLLDLAESWLESAEGEQHTGASDAGLLPSSGDTTSACRTLVAFNGIDALMGRNSLPVIPELRLLFLALFCRQLEHSPIDIVLFGESTEWLEMMRTWLPKEKRSICIRILETDDQSQTSGDKNVDENVAHESTTADTFRGTRSSTENSTSEPVIFINKIGIDSLETKELENDPIRRMAHFLEDRSKKSEETFRNILKSGNIKNLERFQQNVDRVETSINRNRFGLTILSRCLLTCLEVNPPAVNGRWSRFLQERTVDVAHAISVSPPDRRLDRLLESVLDVYDEVFQHFPAKKKEEIVERRISGHHWTNLQRQILRHLAIFSVPIQLTPLIYCPEVQQEVEPCCRELFESYDFALEMAWDHKQRRSRIRDNHGDDTWTVGSIGRSMDEVKEIRAAFAGEEWAAAKERRNEQLIKRPHEWVVETAVRQLVRAGLVFKVHPFRELDLPPEHACPVETARADIGNEIRFAVHSSVRNFIYRRLGSSTSQGGETNFYGISIHAIQPLDLPTPNNDIYRFLDKLVVELTHPRLPDFIQLGERLSRGHPHVPRCHRAALGVLRSCFSIAVIARITDMPVSEGPNDEPVQHFERYRSRIRSLINRQLDYQQIFAPTKNSTVPEENEARDRRISSAPFSFHQDEITWLFNERALVSFAQGRLYDAAPLFQQAMASNDKVDPSQKRPNCVRITLNQTLVDIDRGHLRRARETLGKLASSDVILGSDTIAIVIDGYLALIDHLEGHLERARKGYASVTRRLIQHGRYRALGIFNRHFADLLRALGDRSAAARRIEAAIAAAEAGRQQDVLQLARVSQARLIHDDPGNRPQAQRILQLADTYADRSGLLKLKADVLEARGGFLLSQGEIHLAGRIAVHSLRLCAENGMTLRKISALILMGRIMGQRGNRSSAENMLAVARGLADRIGYQLMVERAERALLDLAEGGEHPS